MNKIKKPRKKQISKRNDNNITKMSFKWLNCSRIKTIWTMMMMKPEYVIRVLYIKYNTPKIQNKFIFKYYIKICFI